MTGSRKQRLRSQMYDRQLTNDEIRAKVHRDFVGGLWEELGELQLRFLKEQGLRPNHRLVDIGCGALRGGVRFIGFLEMGNYFGIDANASLIAAGQSELTDHRLEDKRPQLLVNERFELSRFGVRFDYAVAQSLFTHLPMNAIVRCLVETRRTLAPGGVLFASYFEAPEPAHLGEIAHPPAGIVTRYDADPFHHSFDELQSLARFAGLTARRIGEWNHPRGQKMVAFGCR
jgi:SAM-dependent methyltransferase